MKSPLQCTLVCLKQSFSDASGRNNLPCHYITTQAQAYCLFCSISIGWELKCWTNAHNGTCFVLHSLVQMVSTCRIAGFCRINPITDPWLCVMAPLGSFCIYLTPAHLLPDVQPLPAACSPDITGRKKLGSCRFTQPIYTQSRSVNKGHMDSQVARVLKTFW